MKIELNGQERRVVGRVLTERKALLIETADDTTQPDTARHAGSIELSIIEPILRKCYSSRMSSRLPHQQKRLGAAEGVGKLSRPTWPSLRIAPDCLPHPLEALGWRLGGSGERNPNGPSRRAPHNGRIGERVRPPLRDAAQADALSELHVDHRHDADGLPMKQWRQKAADWQDKAGIVRRRGA